MIGGNVMATKNTSRGHVTIVSPATMAKIVATPKIKYDAKKAAKEARKKLRKQGVIV